MPRNERRPLSPDEQVQVQKLIEGLGSATAARVLGVSMRALEPAARGLELNEPTRLKIRSSDWIRPSL